MFTNKGHARYAIKKLSSLAMPVFTTIDNWLAMNHTTIFVFFCYLSNTSVTLAPKKFKKLWGLRLIYWQIFSLCAFLNVWSQKKEGMNVRRSGAVWFLVCALGLSIIHRSATQCNEECYKRKTNSLSHSSSVCIHFVPNKDERKRFFFC